MSKSKSIESSADSIAIEPMKIKGLTIDEIRYRRALTALKKDFPREKVRVGGMRIAKNSPFSRGYDSSLCKFGRTGAIVGKLFGGLNYLDYAMMGFSLFQTGRKLVGFVKGKKR